MPCDTLAEFRDLATYRKSFNGDLMMAKSRPQKFYFFETFPFETTKGPLLVLGKIDKALLDEVKKLGKAIKAKGLCSFKDNVVALTVTDGKIGDDQLKKALTLAQVRRESTISTGDADRPENKFADKAKGPVLAEPPEKFVAARKTLQGLVDGADKLAWNDRDIKRASQAQDKITEVERFIREVDSAIDAAEAPAKLLAQQIQREAADPRAKQYQAEFDATRKLMKHQDALVKDAAKKVADLRRDLVSLKLVSKGLEASEKVVELRWRSTTLKFSEYSDKTRIVHNEKDVLKAIAAEVSKRIGANKETASKFLNPTLQNQAVSRAIAAAKEQCPWNEIEEGGRWGPLSSLTVWVGKPALHAGWGFGKRRNDQEETMKVAGVIFDQFSKGKCATKDMAGRFDAVLRALDEHLQGIKPQSPIVAYARVKLERNGGSWASIGQAPDPQRSAADWNLTGKSVRVDAKTSPVSAPSLTKA